ncbi:hypothetical protein ABW21_db0208106 [Orbilia brochopaga]|nr:hypothetical protein ABW21_db0208106 [Drechslerella brochopaga]
MVKRKATGQENVQLPSRNQQLPSIAAILNENPAPAKRVKTSTTKKTTAPLADISNSPAAITWTAFPHAQLPSIDAVKAAEQVVVVPVAVSTQASKKAAPKPKAAAKAKPPAKKPGRAGTKAEPLPDHIAAVHLCGEDTDSVPVYDTADTIRRKITVALSGEHSKASLLRAMTACTSNPTPIPATSFQGFTKAKGKLGGCRNRCFYAAYVYFEKVRVAEGKKKTKTRVEMEEAWGANGLDWRHAGQPAWVGPGEDFHIDQYGREIIIGPGGKTMPMLGDFSVRPFTT